MPSERGRGQGRWSVTAGTARSRNVGSSWTYGLETAGLGRGLTRLIGCVPKSDAMGPSLRESRLCPTEDLLRGEQLDVGDTDHAIAAFPLGLSVSPDGDPTDEIQIELIVCVLGPAGVLEG